jgi:hypothetical protein
LGTIHVGVARNRPVELFVQEILETDALNVRDEIGCRAPRRLFEKAHDIRGGEHLLESTQVRGFAAPAFTSAASP